MSNENIQRPRRYYYQLPTRLNIEDKLISLGPLALTLRQGSLFVLGGCIAVQIWRNLEFLTFFASLGLALRIGLTCLPLVATCICAFLRIADRYCENWAMVLWRYFWQPKARVWRPVPASLRMMKSTGQRARRRSERRRVSGSWLMEEESE